MAGLPFTLTTAGLALANPANTGTNAIVVERIGVSAIAIPGDPSDNLGLLALPNELKRLATFGGVVAGDDIIHVTVRDDSADTYQLRTFGLYSAQGVLLAFYSQATPIMEKASASMLLLAADLVFTTPIAAELVFGDTTFVNPPATTVVAGVVELATSTETVAGADTQRAVTPFGLAQALLSWAGNFASAIHGHAIGEVAGLANALAGKSPTGHKHDAADVETGVFNVARIPSLAISKVTGLIDALAGKAASVHAHAASDISSGTFDVARIPALALSKITGLVDALAEKAAAEHQHAASAISSGVLSVLRIPDLAMAKIIGLIEALAAKADLTGSTFTGPVTLPRIDLDGPAGSERPLYLRSSGSNRWRFTCNAAGETGDNAGSNFAIDRYTDAGARIDTPFSINRATGQVTIAYRPRMGGETPWDSGNFNPALYATTTALTAGLAPKADATAWTDAAANSPVTGYKQFVGLGSATISTGDLSGARAGLEVRGSGGAAYMAFNRPGQFGTMFGLDTDNEFKIGGWSKGATAYRLHHDGNHDTIGQVAFFAAAGAPAGWLKCNGAAVSRSTYSALFNRIGTTFGAGDGGSTFNLPDLRGEFVRGWDDGRGIDSGRAFGSAQASQNLSHTHTSVIGQSSGGSSGGQYSSGDDYTNSVYTNANTSASGGNESRPRNTALLACIKY